MIHSQEMKNPLNHLLIIYELLTKPPISILDIAIRRKSRLLSTLLLVITSLFLLLNTLSFIFTPDYKLPPPIIGGYALFMAGYLLNRTGRYHSAASLIIFSFPIVAITLIITGRANNPLVTFNILIISIILGSILLSVRGVVILFLGTISGIILVRQWAPEVFVNTQDFVFVAIVNTIIAALAIISMYNRDLIERDRQAELKKREEQFRVLYNQSPIMMHSIDTHGKLISVNNFWLKTLGYQENDVLGCRSSDFLTEASRRYARAEILPAFFKTGTVRDVPYQFVKKDGTVIDVLLSATALKDEQGQVFQSLAVIEDVTERKQAKDALESYSEQLETMVQARTTALEAAQDRLIRQEKLATLGQLAGGVAHELRNPLGVIKNTVYYLNLLLANAQLEVRESLEIANKQIIIAEQIINTLLDFARPRPLHVQQTDLNQLIQEELVHIIVPDNVQVEKVLDLSIPYIQASLGQLRQVFTNLVLNAIQAMPNGGTLSLQTVSPDKAHVQILVTDTGQGIPDDILPKLFEPLFTTKAQGIGLGLAITKNIVAQHKGRIDIETEVGQGTTFTLTFPVGDENQSA